MLDAIEERAGFGEGGHSKAVVVLFVRVAQRVKSHVVGHFFAETFYSKEQIRRRRDQLRIRWPSKNPGRANLQRPLVRSYFQATIFGLNSPWTRSVSHHIFTFSASASVVANLRAQSGHGSVRVGIRRRLPGREHPQPTRYHPATLACPRQMGHPDHHPPLPPRLASPPRQ